MSLPHTFLTGRLVSQGAVPLDSSTFNDYVTTTQSATATGIGGPPYNEIRINGAGTTQIQFDEFIDPDTNMRVWVLGAGNPSQPSGQGDAGGPGGVVSFQFTDGQGEVVTGGPQQGWPYYGSPPNGIKKSEFKITNAQTQSSFARAYFAITGGGTWATGIGPYPNGTFVSDNTAGVFGSATISSSNKSTSNTNSIYGGAGGGQTGVDNAGNAYNWGGGGGGGPGGVRSYDPPPPGSGPTGGYPGGLSWYGTSGSDGQGKSRGGGFGGLGGGGAGADLGTAGASRVVIQWDATEQGGSDGRQTINTTNPFP